MQLILLAIVKDKGTTWEFAMVVDKAALLLSNGSMIPPRFGPNTMEITGPINYRITYPDGTVKEGMVEEECRIHGEQAANGHWSPDSLLFDYAGRTEIWKPGYSVEAVNDTRNGFFAPGAFAIYRKDFADEGNWGAPIFGRPAEYWLPGKVQPRRSERVRRAPSRYSSAGFGPMFA